MAELTELSGTRSEDFFGPVERCHAEYMTRKKLKGTASIGFQRGGRDPARGITLPIIFKLRKRSVVAQQPIAAAVDFGDNLSSLPVNCRQWSEGFNQCSWIAELQAQANCPLGWEQQLFARVWHGCVFLGHAAGNVDSFAGPMAFLLESALEFVEVPRWCQCPAVLVRALKGAIESFARGADPQREEHFFLIESGECLADLIS